MKIHEFQAKQLFARYGLPVPDGRECTSPDQAARAFEELKSPKCVVKAQIHAGGRGKGGGVKLVSSAAEARDAAAAMLGRRLVTHQTGPEGQEVRRLWVEKGSRIKRELYVGVAIDREARRPVVMAATEGGVDIEEVAAKSPEKILRAPFSPAGGLEPKEALRLARGLKVPPGLEPATVQFLLGLTRLFVELDASLAEVNPLVLTEENRLLALDAKLNLDPNALFRHEDLLALRDLHEEDEKEIEAGRHGLSYIALDGDIGCMVNGAGLAMATMDVIQLHGGEPANFLDVGGGASTQSVTAAFKILLSDKRVAGVLINIFGGIMKCDVIAEGVVAAVREVHLAVPLVVRLEGTNVERGKQILAASGLPITAAGDLDDAARKVCAAVGSRALSAQGGHAR